MQVYIDGIKYVKEVDAKYNDNFGKLWFTLKEYLNTKNSHGKNELLKEMKRLEDKK